MKQDLKYKDITEKIIGAFFEVHKFLGNACLSARQGFQEVIYQRALAYELSQSNLDFERELEQDIFYKELQDVHLAQVLNYLKAYRLEVALLINFGSKSLTFKRLVL
jgi:hypothetical protein